MKGITLYPNITYIPLSDEEGDFGLMIMTDNEGDIVTTKTIESREMFKDTYSRWVPQVQVFYAGVN